MSRCPHEEMIVPYLQEELSASELAQMEEHIAECALCEEQIAKTKQFLDRMGNVREEQLSHDLAPRILERIPDDAWKRAVSTAGSRRYYWQLAAGIAACLLLALAGWQMFLRSGIEHEPPSLISTPESEAVLKALDWLASVQEPTGAWDPEKWDGKKNFRVGLTSLALLALLGNDEHPFESPRAASINRAIEFVIQQQNVDGRLGPQGSSIMYNHGIATVALLETYGLTKDKKLKEPLDRAIRFICAAQTAKGGWGYRGSPAEPANTAVSVWPLHALLVAHRMGWDDTKGNVENGIAWIRSMVDKHGSVGYTGLGDFPYGSETLTAMGAVCLFSHKDAISDEDPMRMKNALRRIAAKKEQKIDYYRWYFLTYALQATDKNQSDRWTAKMRKVFTEGQVKTGTLAGSWEPSDRWSSAGGRIYATAMATLSLESELRAPRIAGWMRTVH